MNEIFATALRKASSGRYKQKELAEMAGISVPYLNDLFRGRKSGQETVRRRLGEVLGYEDYESFLDIGRRELGLPALRPDGAREAGGGRADEFWRVPFSDQPRLNGGFGGAITISHGPDLSPVMVHGPTLGRAGPDGLRAIRVGDDAMEPLIALGGIILVDLDDQDWSRLKEGSIYVLSWDLVGGECAVRRLKWVERGKLAAIESEKAAAATIYLRPGEVRLIGRVIGSWRDHN